MSDGVILAEGRRVIGAESAALQQTLQGLDTRFCEAVKAVACCQGKVVTSAIGKSGFIARKLASTLASLSIPAMFIHPIEGMHGDLGMLAADDLIVGISHSGNTEELLSFMLTAKLRFHAQLIAIVGVRGGSLDGLADIVLETGVVEEACALGLAPTTSSTAALALGDALAVAVSRLKGVQAKDFAALHPAGELGRRLYTPIAAIMRQDFPTVDAEQALREVVSQMTAGGLGMVVVQDNKHGRLGIVTDGDVRRTVQRSNNWLDLQAGEVMSSPPKAIGIEALSMDALAKMESEKITSLVVLDGQGTVCGLVHIHDILRHGLGL
jgi:arabinose-5-phosphate isomerase